MLSCEPAKLNCGICESCIHFNAIEVETGDGKIGYFGCTTSGCNNGSKYKPRNEQTEMEALAKHDRW